MVLNITPASSGTNVDPAFPIVPAPLLKSETTYVLDLSPSLEDAFGQGIDFAGCALQLGGQAAPGGWTMGGMMGTGSVAMGPGWQSDAGTWGYGMISTFTTA